MLNLLAQATDQSISVSQVVGYALATLVVALAGGGAGITIQKKRGSGKQSNGKLQPGIDYVTPSQCDRNHKIAAQQQRELQELRDKQASERHEQTMGAIGKLEKAIGTIHQRIDELLRYSRKT